MRRGTRSTVAPRRLMGRVLPTAPGPPTITNPGTLVSIEGVPVGVQLEATGATEWEVTGLPTGLSMTKGFGGGFVSGTPTVVGEVTVKVTVKGPGGEASTTFGWRVEAAPVAPPEEPTPTPVTESSLFAQDVYEALEPMRVQGGDPVIAALAEAVGSMFLQVEEAVRAREGFDAQTQTFDIDRTPAFLIPFVGQAAGVKVTKGLSAAAQRTQVREGRAWHRGKLDQITAEIQRTLTGTKKVRYSILGPWQIEVFTELAETPNLAATEAAGRAVKPAGIVMSFALSTVPTIDQGTKTIDASKGKIDTAILADIT